MVFPDVLVGIQIILSGVVAWLLFGVLRIRKEGAEAYKDTINVLKEQVKLVGPERFADYRKLVDLEKEPLARQIDQLAREKSEATGQLSEVAGQLQQYRQSTRALLDVYGGLIPYAPLDERITLIEKLDLPEVAKASLRRIAERAPDLSISALLRGAYGSGPYSAGPYGSGTQAGERLKERMTMPLFSSERPAPVEGRVPPPTLPGTKSESP